MPELPEVETTRRGIAPHVQGKTVRRVITRVPALRWPIPATLNNRLTGQVVNALERRAKYLLFRFDSGTLIGHLGMSGSMRICTQDTPPEKHDHVDLVLTDGNCLRLRDPRRFGALLFTAADPCQHELLRELGPEPLGEAFDADYLYRRSRKRRLAVKAFIMDAHTVVGVGNIYASEALHRAGIHPMRAAGRIGPGRYQLLVAAIRNVLQEAIDAGGTTLQDFTNADGKPGYFRHRLAVYGRNGEPCNRCGQAIRSKLIGQRSTFYCAACQR